MRQYPFIYSQRDPKWAGQRLGTIDSTTIGGYGCILTCQAMKAGYYGHEITPNALDDIFTNKNVYSNGNLLPDNGVTQIFTDISLIKTYDYANAPADLTLLHQLSADDSTTVTIEVDFDHDPNDGIQTHFVELHSYDGTTLKIYDPWYGTDDDFTLHYGTNITQTILKFAVYKGTPQVGTGDGNIYKGYDLTNKESMKVAIDILVAVQQGQYVNRADIDSICATLGLAAGSSKDAIIASVNQLKADRAIAQAEAEKAKKDYEADEVTIGNLNKKITDLEAQIGTLGNQVTDLTTKLQTAENQLAQGGSYQGLYEQAEADLKQVKQDYSDFTQTTNRQIAQLKNSSALTMSLGDLWKTVLTRSLHLS